ncbi:putative protein [BD1-7 clade bacterium]|uniref:Luciferase-like domain-containing protein n=1 Tax=BD1-7 clade bacterium TaxID=2029982 RepID=A0A5S9MX73_9GAMM|nr:putative protein [BD1-7 clade bacterium]CAA0082899.1 putative protein [BD1-7 clade bacterium]
MKFWQAISWTETEQLAELAQFGEELGFYGFMNGDHVAYPTQIAPNYPYSQNGIPPMSCDWEYPDPWITIANMAAHTTTLKFTTGVYLLALRSPHEAARATSTLSVLTQNRFIFGVGAGWMPEEFDIFDVDFHTRGRRLNEALEIVEILWRGEPVAFKGEFYHFPEVILKPAPKQPIPVFVGGDSSYAFERAARFGDGWIGRGYRIDEVPDLLNRLFETLKKRGRADDHFETLVPLTESFNIDTLKRLHDKGMTATVNYPYRMVLGDNASLDDKKRYMETFAEKFIRPFDT